MMNECMPKPLIEARYLSDPLTRKQTTGVDVAGVRVGGNAPIVVQSMTNTDTADVEGTVAQIMALNKSGLRTCSHNG